MISVSLTFQPNFICRRYFIHYYTITDCLPLDFMFKYFSLVNQRILHHVFVIPKHRACFCLTVEMIFPILTSNTAVLLKHQIGVLKNKKRYIINSGGPVVKNVLSNAGNLVQF